METSRTRAERGMVGRAGWLLSFACLVFAVGVVVPQARADTGEKADAPLIPRSEYGKVDITLPQSSRYRPSLRTSTPAFEALGRYPEQSSLRRLSRPVGRLDVLLEGGMDPCTAVLIADDLILTNNHCIPGTRDRGVVEEATLLMGYYLQGDEDTQRFQVDIDPVETDVSLDYSILRVRGAPGRIWGVMPLEARDPAPGEALLVIHHPLAAPKKITRGNCQARNPDPVHRTNIWHTCDTLPGSSGAPILTDDRRRMIGLHFGGFGDRAVAQFNRAKRVLSLRDESPILRGVLGDRVPLSVFQDCPECPDMVVIPAGRFTMGSPEDEEGRSSDEGPLRPVRVPRFALGRTEVTFAQWDACVADGYCRPITDDEGWGRGNRPVINVSWNDITGETVSERGFLAWMNAKVDGAPYRLPSEAEWEYAARAGTTTPWSFAGDEADVCTYANHADRSTDYSWRNTQCSDGVGIGTAEVGTFKANAFGLYDMHGNVWEWVQDCWRGNYNGAPTDGSAWLAGNCSAAPVRGGSWSSSPRGLRSAYRNGDGRVHRNDNIGFRLARTL